MISGFFQVQHRDPRNGQGSGRKSTTKYLYTIYNIIIEIVEIVEIEII